ncbi:hypothetical protein [Sphingobium yanoikuyae]|uniref:hypothetical protein n=1 Tax=Sphingobium yanoikuyae TaxID=13690 RepID=UPI0035B15524
MASWNAELTAISGRFLLGSFSTQERTDSYRMCLAPIGAMIVYQGWLAECQLSWSQTGLRKVHTTSPKPIVVKHTAECKAHVQMVSGIEKDQQTAEVSSGSSIHGMSWKFISFTHANPRSGIALLERKARYLINALCINLVSHERSVTAIGRQPSKRDADIAPILQRHLAPIRKPLFSLSTAHAPPVRRHPSACHDPQPASGPDGRHPKRALAG